MHGKHVHLCCCCPSRLPRLLLFEQSPVPEDWLEEKTMELMASWLVSGIDLFVCGCSWSAAQAVLSAAASSSAHGQTTARGVQQERFGACLRLARGGSSLASEHPMQSDIGVPHEALLEIRAFKAPQESLYSFMRSLPPEQVSWRGPGSKTGSTAGGSCPSCCGKRGMGAVQALGSRC